MLHPFIFLNQTTLRLAWSTVQLIDVIVTQMLIFPFTADEKLYSFYSYTINLTSALGPGHFNQHYFWQVVPQGNCSWS